MPKPAEPLPPDPELTRTAAFKEWLRTRNWERARNWRELGGENRGFKIAGAAGLVGLLLAGWFMSGWLYRTVWLRGSSQAQVAATPVEPQAFDKTGAKPAEESTEKATNSAPDLVVQLDTAGTPPAAEIDPFMAPIVKKPAPKSALPDDLLAEEPEQKVAVTSTKPVSMVAEVPAKEPQEVASLPLEEPKTEPTADVAAPPAAETAKAPLQSLPEEPVRKAEAPVEPQEVIEPVDPVVEKPKVVADNTEQPRTRDEEGFGTTQSDSSATVVRGEAKEPVAPVAEKPAEAPVAAPADREPLPASEDKPAEEPVKPVVPVEKKEDAPISSSVDDERFGAQSSTPLPETAAPKKDPEPVEEKPVAVKPADEKPVVVDPPAVKAEPFSEPLPAETKPATVSPEKPKEMPPEEEPLPARREPEKPMVQPASREQPAEPPVASLRPTTAPQIEFDLIAPLRVERGKIFKIGFQVTNIGTTEIDGLVFSIKLPPSLRHFVGREIEYHIDHLAPGKNRTAQMHVLAEEADMALIRAEMTTGTTRLASSDRQIQVRGSGMSGTAQRAGRNSMIVPAQFLAFPPSAARPDCECQVP